jgi:hypothetical protein
MYVLNRTADRTNAYTKQSHTTNVYLTQHSTYSICCQDVSLSPARCPAQHIYSDPRWQFCSGFHTQFPFAERQQSVQVTPKVTHVNKTHQINISTYRTSPRRNFLVKLARWNKGTKSHRKLRSTLPVPRRRTTEDMTCLAMSPTSGETKHSPSVSSLSTHGSCSLGTCLSGRTDCVLFGIETYAVIPTNSHVQNMFDHILSISNNIPSLLISPWG